MIGAGPGENLPTFPEPSHSAEGAGLRPYVTARQALDRIRARRGVDPLHNPRDMRRANLQPWDADRILPRCITTSGGQNYHYGGKRDLTLREYATLQGFPVYHAFEPPYIKKQIGNAFPPVVAEHLYRHILNCLLHDDGMLLQSRGRRQRHPDQRCGMGFTHHAVVIEDEVESTQRPEPKVLVDITSDDVPGVGCFAEYVIDDNEDDNDDDFFGPDLFAQVPIPMEGGVVVDQDGDPVYDSDVTLGRPEFPVENESFGVVIID